MVIRFPNNVRKQNVKAKQNNVKEVKKLVENDPEEHL